MTENTRKAQHAPESETSTLAEIASLRRELTRARRRAANLEAAIHAALGAQEDGETDPFYYLRDEIAGGRGTAYGT
jgi:hypothetical protein